MLMATVATPTSEPEGSSPTGSDIAPGSELPSGTSGGPVTGNTTLMVPPQSGTQLSEFVCLYVCMYVHMYAKCVLICITVRACVCSQRVIECLMFRVHVSKEDS